METDDNEKTTACIEYDSMFEARPKLLQVPSGRGTAVRAACRAHRDGVSTRSLLDRPSLKEIYGITEISDHFDFPGENHGKPRVKRRANMGQEMDHNMRQTRVRRRVQELDQAKNRNASEQEDFKAKPHYLVVTPRGVRTGISALSEDFPKEINQHEKATLKERKGEINRKDTKSGEQGRVANF